MWGTDINSKDTDGDGTRDGDEIEKGRDPKVVGPEDSLEKTRVDIQQGKTMSASMAESSLYSPLVIHMIMIGEESGALDEMMKRVSLYYQSRVDIFVARLSILIEPIMLIFMGCVIGFIVVALFLPIFTLTSSIH